MSINILSKLFEEADIIYSCDARDDGPPFAVHKKHELSTLEIGLYYSKDTFDTCKLYPKYPAPLGVHKTESGRAFYFLKHFETIEEFRAFKGWTKFTEGRGWH